MPQEVCIPVVTCKKFRDKAAERVKTKKVDISILLSDLKITSNRQRIRFIQNESVSEKVLPRTVRFVFVDGDEPISDQPVVTFNASSENPIDREQFVSFAFRNKNYDGTKTYQLKLLDEANGVEFARFNFKIRILVGNEFDGF